MRTVFADTCYWIALLNPKDELHDTAVRVTKDLGEVLIVTSEVVLTEFLNYCSKYGPRVRESACALIARIKADPNTQIIPQTSVNFSDAATLYRERIDKTWSHTDCASFRHMDEKSLLEALTHDEHYLQAGLVALLR